MYRELIRASQWHLTPADLDGLTLAQLFLMLRSGEEDAPRSYSQAEIHAHLWGDRAEFEKRRELAQLAEYRATKQVQGDQGDGVSACQSLR